MRFRTGRPTGRVFFWWLILAVAVLAGAEAQATTSKTSIVDVLYRADGTPAQGTLLISWPAFTTTGGDAIAAGSLTVSLGPDGSVQAALFPNTGSTPQGTYYKVGVDLDDGTRSTERWVVPQVSQTTIAAIRSSLVPESQAMQFVGRDYVDSAISSALGSSVAVELTGNQTITGVKTFQSSPQVPTPANSGDAANRQFVLDTVSSFEASVAAAQATPGMVNATQYQVNGAALSSSNLSDSASLAKTSEIPTQTSQLTNNSGFITAAGAPVQSVNGMMGAVTLAIPAAQVNSDWNASSGPSLIVNKPIIPTAQVSSDWNATSGVAQILNKPTIPSFSGVTSDGANGLSVAANLAASTMAPGKIQDWHDAMGACAVYRGQISVVDCGADPTTTTDSTVAIRAAATASCSGPASGRVIPVYFPPGTYLAHELDMSGLACSPYFKGDDDNSTWIQYNGAGGAGTFISKWPAMSFGGLHGIGVIGYNPTTGAMAAYGMWLTSAIDNGFSVQHARFSSTLSHAIYAPSDGYVNWHMDHLRFDSIGGCAVYVTGGAGMENRPFTMTDFTLDNHYPGTLPAGWLTANSLGDGTHWGDAVFCGNNMTGMSVKLAEARIEMNAPQIIQGNIDNGALVREFNTPSGVGGPVIIDNVLGYGSSLHEPAVSSAAGLVNVQFINSYFLANGCVKTVSTQQIVGDKYCTQASQLNWGYSGQQSGGILLGAAGQAVQRIESITAPETSSSYATYRAGDLVLHPQTEIAPGTKGAMRYVTAPLTGTCRPIATQITAAGVVTASSTTITGFDPGAVYLSIGANITLVGAGPAAANLNTQITAIDFVNKTITVADTPSTGVNPATINWQTCTFHELPGAQTGSAAPSSGVWAAGEKVWNTNQASGQPIYWVCQSTGTPAGGCPGAWQTGPVYGTSGSYLLTSQLSTDGTMADDSDSEIPSQKAVVTYVGNQISGLGVSPSRRLSWQKATTAVTGNGSVQTVYTYTIPGGTIPTGGCVHAQAWFTHTGSNAVLYNWAFGGTGDGVASTSNSTVGYQTIDVTICNDPGSTTSQTFIRGPWIAYNAILYVPAPITSAINTANAAVLSFTFTVASPDTVTGKGFLVTLQ